MSVENVRRYIANGCEHVPGWCSTTFMEIMGHLAEEMNAAGVFGGACEIGVYQGKFIIALSHAVEGRPSLAIDLFDNQQENVDSSGAGKTDMLAGFRQNVANYGYSSLADMTANSFALTVRDRIAISERFGPFQFFSIDGGHQPEHVVNDYKFAEEVTHHGGVIIIDDIGNPGWPGVMEGVAHVFINLRPKFIPLMMGQNKLVLAGLAYHMQYFSAMRARMTAQMPDQQLWSTKFFGHDMLSLV